MTEKQLETKIKLIEPKDKETRNSLVCALIGHSRIRTFFFGYNYCGRCGAELGDSLGGAWEQTDEYIEGHDDPDCLEALSKMGWQDKLYVPKKLYVRTPTNSKNKGDKK